LPYFKVTGGFGYGLAGQSHVPFALGNMEHLGLVGRLQVFVSGDDLDAAGTAQAGHADVITRNVVREQLRENVASLHRIN
jgi:hypothetical protein